MSRTSKNSKQLETLWDIRKGLCYYCNRFTYLKTGSKNKLHYKGTKYIPKSSGELASRDHKVPLVRGGSDTIKNMVLSCKDCNQIKDCSTTEEYMIIKAEWGDNFKVALYIDQEVRRNERNRINRENLLQANKANKSLANKPVEKRDNKK